MKSEEVEVYPDRKPVPSRDKKTGELLFQNHPSFRPNLTPEEVLRAGSFGGTYYRDIHSGVTGLDYVDTWKELPSEWLDGLDVKKMISSQTYRNELNAYKVHCGGDLVRVIKRLVSRGDRDGVVHVGVLWLDHSYRSLWVVSVVL